ncbi:potassium uptake protein, TrkH family [Saccharicrinis carchari]|uniref:Potassium uptake protein, TrkH family n=1 Tax=Saccharicrinis carchari TaxID=1168039 RepID=A0A521BDU9_SACCC|nr:potassium transporter TrkG [Saccharicrinis carchari]SMO45277.1 potassium uptake protein, TrkH family [Saccharicrinis carchari]
MKFKALKYLGFFFSSMAMCLIVFDFGFSQKLDLLLAINTAYPILLGGIIVGVPIKYIVNFKNYQKVRIWLIEITLWLFYVGVMVVVPFGSLVSDSFSTWANPKIILFFAFALSFVREASELKLNWRYQRTNPAIIFVLSFALLILVGSLLLMLPKATHSDISFTNALFTSTSAVCVTGLTVVDTGSYFTVFGQVIILILMQLGGLGIMTFTSFFAYFFLGGSSYQNLLLLGDFTNENKISKVLSTLKKILVFTLLAEGVGVVLIYLHVKDMTLPGDTNTIFFSLFHAVSAFCNAGFSTLSNSFFEIGFRFNYSLHFVIALLFIVGGLGFPVIINLYAWCRYYIGNGLQRFYKRKGVFYRANVLTLNSKLVLYTTFGLLLVGTLIFWALEYNNTLAQHRGFGKLLTAFFAAATPRTAGFTTIDTAMMGVPAMMFVVFFMWIGASPASTGGGIKTSTFALAFLNAISLAKGKSKVELNKREIQDSSLRRSFAFVFLSLFFIGLVILLITVVEPDKKAHDLIFEVFSAFSTVGLSRGITGDLSIWGKYLIISTMFIGRIGALTFLTSLLKKIKQKNNEYPTEGVLIN